MNMAQSLIASMSDLDHAYSSASESPLVSYGNTSWANSWTPTSAGASGGRVVDDVSASVQAGGFGDFGSGALDPIAPTDLQPGSQLGASPLSAVEQNASSMMRGEIPQDVVDQLERISAERGIRSGIGAGGRAENLTARDLGRTSLDLITAGTQIGSAVSNDQLNRAGFTENQRQFDTNYNQWAAGFTETQRQFDANYNQSKAGFIENQRQFDTNYNQWKDTFAAEQNQWKAGFQSQLQQLEQQQANWTASFDRAGTQSEAQLSLQGMSMIMANEQFAQNLAANLLQANSQTKIMGITKTLNSIMGDGKYNEGFGFDVNQAIKNLTDNLSF